MLKINQNTLSIIKIFYSPQFCNIAKLILEVHILQQ